MNITTQRETIFNLLLDDYKSGAEGLNSVYIRQTYYIVDVATRIFDNKQAFRDIGLEIAKRIEKNRTATYYLRPLQGYVPPPTPAPAPQPQMKSSFVDPNENLVPYRKDGRTYWDTPENVKLKTQPVQDRLI